MELTLRERELWIGPRDNHAYMSWEIGTWEGALIERMVNASSPRKNPWSFNVLNTVTGIYHLEICGRSLSIQPGNHVITRNLPSSYVCGNGITAKLKARATHT